MTSKSKNQLAFEAFHRANTHVLDAAAVLANRSRHAGRTRGSIAQIFEVLRYSYSLQTAGDDDYKLANAHRAYYARFLMKLMPHLSTEEKPFFLLTQQSVPFVVDWKSLEMPGKPGFVSSTWQIPDSERGF